MKEWVAGEPIDHDYTGQHRVYICQPYHPPHPYAGIMTTKNGREGLRLWTQGAGQFSPPEILDWKGLEKQISRHHVTHGAVSSSRLHNCLDAHHDDS